MPLTLFTMVLSTQLAGIQSTTNESIGPILFRPCTQDETNHRPQRLTKRPAMYVSPFKGDPQRAKAPMTKARAVRKKFHTAMKWKRYNLHTNSHVVIATSTYLIHIPPIPVMFSSVPV